MAEVKSMAAIITTLTNFLKTKNIYPRTHAKAVFFDDKQTLEYKITEINDNLTDLKENGIGDFTENKKIKIGHKDIDGTRYNVYRYIVSVTPSTTQQLVDIPTLLGETPYAIWIDNSCTYHLWSGVTAGGVGDWNSVSSNRFSALVDPSYIYYMSSSSACTKAVIALMYLSSE